MAHGLDAGGVLADVEVLLRSFVAAELEVDMFLANVSKGL